MIFDFMIAVMRFLIDGIATILPSLSIFPAGLAVQIASFMGYVNGWSWLVPISTIVTIMGILVILVLVEFMYFVSMYVLSMIHATIRG
jgi:hypothetical protein